MKRNILLVFLIFICVGLAAEKVAVLDEVNKPDYISIGNGYIYIQEKTSIYIYDLKDFKFVKKFGKEGEGPREFKINPYGGPMVTYPFENKLVISSMAKVSIFTREGEFIKEYKVDPFEGYTPFGKNYVCFGTGQDKDKRTVLTLYLTDAQFKKQKILYQSDFTVGQSFEFNFPLTTFDPDIYREKIYIAAGKEGFCIDVFDKEGKKLYRIKKEHQPIKVRDDHEKKTREWFERSATWRQIYPMFKDRFSFKKYYPAIYQMHVNDDHIYVLTNKIKGINRECVVMDLKGNEKKRLFLPAPELFGMEFLPEFTFHNGSFYILLENEDEEVIELHKTKIH